MFTHCCYNNILDPHVKTSRQALIVSQTLFLSCPQTPWREEIPENMRKQAFSIYSNGWHLLYDNNYHVIRKLDAGDYRLDITIFDIYLPLSLTYILAIITRSCCIGSTSAMNDTLWYKFAAPQNSNMQRILSNFSISLTILASHELTFVWF